MSKSWISCLRETEQDYEVVDSVKEWDTLGKEELVKEIQDLTSKHKTLKEQGKGSTCDTLRKCRRRCHILESCGGASLWLERR